MEEVMKTDEDSSVEGTPVLYSDNADETEVIPETDDGTKNGGEAPLAGTEADASEGKAEKTSEKDSTEDMDEVLRELEVLSGKRYGSISEFPEYRRYLELRKSGILSAEEAFYAVNRRDNADVKRTNTSISGTKGHLTPSAGKRSSGEVFTREDREELAKWGLSATGDALERLWRRAAPVEK